MVSTIGIIYPPPEVRSIVDKTATFVVRNGPEFEEKIRQNEISNPKFNFLAPNDPYHAYYEHKLRELKEGKTSTSVSATTVQQQDAIDAKDSNIQANLQKLNISSKTQDTQSKLIEQLIILKEPPAEFEFILEAPSITPLDIDTIKLTAQFVARNGKPFLTQLLNKEQRNPMFDFLKPQHSHFQYFNKLVEQYTKILLPTKDLMERMRKEVENPFNVLKALNYRVEWERAQQREKAKENELAEKERIAYSQIDWHDFVVVETVDFQANEVGNFPPPTTPADVGARVIAQERLETNGVSEMGSNLFIERILADEARVENTPVAITTTTTTTTLTNLNISIAPEVESAPDVPNKSDLPLPPNPENVIIRRDYDPKHKSANLNAAPKQTTSEQYFKSPITGELISASMMAEHMRISMLNPEWLKNKQKEKKEREEQEEVLATGMNIEKNLKRMAEFRSDMFGSGSDETVIGRRKGGEDDEAKDAVTWDGHSNSMEMTSKRAMTGISLEDQIKAIHQSQGLVVAEDTSKIGPSVPRPQGGPTSMIVPPQMSFVPPPSQSTQPGMYNPMQLQMQMQPPPQQQMIRPPPPMMGMVPPPPPPSTTSHISLPAGSAVEEPASKRQKTEEQLVSEDEFLAQYGHKGPITFSVQVPVVTDKPEWNLNGQIISLTLPLTETIATIKNKLMDSLTMPIAKQKLQLDTIFIKDTNTLAFYNIMPESIIHLQLKERGGRKK